MYTDARAYTACQSPTHLSTHKQVPTHTYTHTPADHMCAVVTPHRQIHLYLWRSLLFLI